MKTNKTYDSIRRNLRTGTLVTLTILNTFISSFQTLATDDKRAIVEDIAKLKELQIEFVYNYNKISEQRRLQYEDLISSVTTKLVDKLRIKIGEHMELGEYKEAVKLYKTTVDDCNKLGIDISEMNKLGEELLNKIRNENKKSSENENYKGYVDEIAPQLAIENAHRFIIRTINNKKYLIAKGEGKLNNKALAFAKMNYRSGLKEAAKQKLEPSSNPTTHNRVKGSLTVTVQVVELEQK